MRKTVNGSSAFLNLFTLTSICRSVVGKLNVVKHIHFCYFQGSVIFAVSAELLSSQFQYNPKVNLVFRLLLYVYKAGGLTVKIGLYPWDGPAGYAFKKGALPSSHCHQRHAQHPVGARLSDQIQCVVV